MRIYLRTTEGLTNSEVIKSIGFHLALVLILTLNAYFFPSESINLETSIRVDLVGLPEKSQSMDPPAQPVDETPAPAKPQSEVNPVPPTVQKPSVAVPDGDAKRKKEQQKAIEKMQALEKINQLEGEVQPTTPIAGNKVSLGNALKGIQQNQVTSYVINIKTIVNGNWNIPQWMADAKLSAQASVFIGGDGTVIRRLISKSSGNQSFDDSILTAIDRSSPFPAPPPALAGVLKNSGFILGFPE